IDLLKDLNIEIVGFSFTSPFLMFAKNLTEIVKKELGIIVVWGGIHATVRPEDSLNYCDFVLRGEGELAMLDFAKAVFGSQSLKGTRNLCYKNNKEVVIEKMRPLIQNLEMLPHQYYGPDDKFFLDGSLKRIEPLKNARELRVFASRGCPFNCSYCYNNILKDLYKEDRFHRIKDVEYVISEIEQGLSNLKKIRKIKFDDDTFVFPEDWIAEFSRSYRKRIGLPFEVLFNSSCLNKDSLKKLKIAGLKHIQVGIQTASEQKAEELYARSNYNSRIAELAWVAEDLNLNVVYDLIFDNPLIGFKDNERLINFLLELPRPFSLFMYSLTVFPGTQLSRILLNKGLISESDIEGEATKSFYQFRLNFSYLRLPEETFAIAIASLTSKSFIPKPAIRYLSTSSFLKRRPLFVRWLAQLSNFIKLFYIGIKMFMQGALNWWKLKEYGLPKRFLIQ
ncbi:MAG TPA: radical SAM protein, partial [Candidatus Omnitrophica bacterium]|nr:radical SAM protein [Candidatus Omnitrophota bacterium]